ncbi:MAG TPA: peroxide stress protein YaaA [Acidimicrobiales bacterium]|nr:peroxide stress protein YaaA [Acidimicrobiales bacterium]
MSDLVLLPPSEGKADGGRGSWSPEAGRFPALAAARRRVLDAYVATMARDAERVVGARGPIADRARGAAAALAAGAAPSLPAHRRFTGVVWEHLHPADLPAAALRRIVVVSGLCGLLAGTDPVPDHRLKLSVSLDGVGRVDRWWRPVLTEALAAHARRRRVWDLLPKEHAAAVDLTGVRSVRVRFEGDTGHAAKAVKGAFARALLLDGGDAVTSFAFDDWRATWEGEDVLVTKAP